MAQVKPIPDGYPRMTPYLIVDGAAQAIEFYKKVFGATEKMRMPSPGGKVGHAELTLGDSMIMLADEQPEMGARAPRAYGGAAVSLMVYVPNVDDTVKSASAAGAKIVRQVENQFYGDRMGTIEDPFGHRWYVATHVEDVPPGEMAKRAAAAMGKST
ncbi:MAG TPA: VOC family protein [Vicinamibacterales bacterium]|nr:VOC family protein [Vicinamibacterales bacterium]